MNQGIPLKRAGHTGPRKQPTNAQRQALRRWWNDDSFGKRKQEDARIWWREKFGHELSRSTCSDTLSAKYVFLDEEGFPGHQATAHRARQGKWPILEMALAEWQLLYDRHPDSGITTGDVLRVKATELWKRLPEYENQAVPVWSEGWLMGFKKRAGLKGKRRHGEGGSAVISAESEAIMEEIRRVGRDYDADCIYNMDESGFYWKRKPDRSLTTYEAKGQKKSKERITVTLTCNATGTERLPPWFIGTACVPLCFRAENLRNGLESVGAVWRNNKSAWMTNHIMIEYLRWFDNRMKAKRKKG
jgi:hypothetical protein